MGAQAEPVHCRRVPLLSATTVPSTAAEMSATLDPFAYTQLSEMALEKYTGLSEELPTAHIRGPVIEKAEKA